MKEQFVTYEIALKLKELGFNDECLACYTPHLRNGIFELISKGSSNEKSAFNERFVKANAVNGCSAPLWQQVIDWVREKQNIYINVEPITFDDEPTYVFEIINLKNGMLLNDINSSFEDPNEAHEQAILKAIDIIKSV